MYSLESVKNYVFIFRVREAQKWSTGFTSKIRWSVQVRGEKFDYEKGVILVEIAWFFLYARLWEITLASSYTWIVIKYMAQLRFIHYHRSGNKNICRSVCKSGINSKSKSCCV